MTSIALCWFVASPPQVISRVVVPDTRVSVYWAAVSSLSSSNLKFNVVKLVVGCAVPNTGCATP